LTHVLEMLEECAPGHTRHLGDHTYRVCYNGLTFFRLGSGKKSDRRKYIRGGNLRAMVRMFEIEDCANAFLGRLY